jgi:hypothetical protein
MKRTVIIGACLLAGCQNAPQVIVDTAGCMAAVQASVAKDAGAPAALIATDAALAAAASPACTGLVVDANNGVITLTAAPAAK